MAREVIYRYERGIIDTQNPEDTPHWGENVNPELMTLTMGGSSLINHITASRGIIGYRFRDIADNFVATVYFADADKADHSAINQTEGRVIVVSERAKIKRGGLLGLVFDALVVAGLDDQPLGRRLTVGGGEVTLE